MLNPDGVYNGYYRMDIFNQNLNRYYNNCNLQKQPSIFALRSLMELYAKQNKLMFYFDLHAHPARKGCFVYGNALNDFVQQVENYVFCKLLALNTKYFEYSCCNFSKKHMNMKDKYQQLTKQGSGRVFAHRCSGIIHSFTLELGYHFINVPNELSEPVNKQFKIGELEFTNSFNQAIEQKYFTQKSFQNVGESLIISILDSIQKNPYSRLPNTQFCTIDNLRRFTAFQVFHEDDRFRMFEVHTYTKVKQINDLIDEIFYNKIQKYLNLKDDIIFNEIEWPQCFVPMKKIQYKEKDRQKDNKQYKEYKEYKEYRQYKQYKQYKEQKQQKDKQQKDKQKEKQKEKQKQRQRQKQKSMTPIQSSGSQKIHLPYLDNYKLLKKKLTIKQRSNTAKKQMQKNQRSVESSQESSEQAESEKNERLKVLDISQIFQEPRQIKHINLTFEQNVIIFPTIQKNNSITKTQNNKSNKHSAQDQLKKQLFKEIEHFKKEMKQQFTKDIKKQVSEQINRSSFIRGYLKNRKQQVLAKNRKNQFFPHTEKQITLASVQPHEENSRISIKLPFLTK